jgi:GH15 family glucan-1,4-alpha-glucosidase
VQHPVGAHALLADGRTAALVDPDGNIAWLPWPRIDSPPCLLSILDDVVGGQFTLAPADPGSTVIERACEPGTLVLRTVWRSATGELTVHDALAWDGSPRLVRTLRARGRVDVVVQLALAPNAARAHASASAAGGTLLVHGGGVDLVVVAPGEWSVDDDGVSRCRFPVDSALCSVVLGNAGVALESASLDGTRAHFATAVPNLVALTPNAMASTVLGDTTARQLLRQATAVLTGLRQRDGGIVAAPSSSIPQWPGSARTWDYRYSWLRDTALAGMAMLRAGLLHDAAGLGDFLGEATTSLPPAALLRVDGSAPPREQTLDHLRGYRDARPVRLGNAASEQPQLDVAGEVLEFAAGLAAREALPQSFARGAARVADWTADHWNEPDHGIWEIRGRPRRYTHSRVLAWVGLTHAAALADEGEIVDGAERWRAAARDIRADVLAVTGPLQLTDAGGGPDAALAQAVLCGLFDAGDPRASATLDAITQGLDRNGLIDRHDPEQDPSKDPCGPFLFPTFWLADALQRIGRDGSRHFAAAVSARGALDLFGEVADPNDNSPLGNYPQVQSHASFLLAAIDAPVHEHR